MNKSLIYAALVAVFSGSATARMADSSSVQVPELQGRGCFGQNQDADGRSNSTGGLVGRTGYGRGDVVGRSTGDAQEMKREVVTEKRDASSLKTIEVAGRNKYGNNCGGSTQTASVQASTAPSPTAQQQQSSGGGSSGTVSTTAGVVDTGTTTTTTGTGTTTASLTPSSTYYIPVKKNGAISGYAQVSATSYTDAVAAATAVVAANGLTQGAASADVNMLVIGKNMTMNQQQAVLFAAIQQQQAAAGRIVKTGLATDSSVSKQLAVAGLPQLDKSTTTASITPTQTKTFTTTVAVKSTKKK